MDTRYFDALVRSLSESGSRRGLLGFLGALPLTGGLLALLDGDESEAQGRRRRRKKAHKHGKGRHKHKKHKPKCKAHAKTKTYAGTCGSVKNNCKKTVDCGPCDCDPPCGACETCTGDFVCEPCEPCCDEVCCSQANAVCHAETGACCVSDSKAQTCDGQCGDVVNNCGVTVDCGSCTCGGGCPACRVCDKETDDCVADPSQAGDPCGEEGQVCQRDGASACEATSCPACTTCGGDGQCASCTSLGQICCDETCVDGVCCEDSNCPNAGAPDCVGHDCVCAANDDTACPADKSCCDDGCANLDSDPEHCGACGTACGTRQTCQGRACGIDCGGDFCPTATHICDGGTCQSCDVFPTCTHTTVQSAIDALPSGSTIRICAGTYTGNVAVTKNLTLIGAGDGSNSASNTILDAADSGRVVHITEGQTASLEGLRITGGLVASSAGINNLGTLTMSGCMVTENSANSRGGESGGIGNSGSLIMTDCAVSLNDSAGRASGISNFGSITLTNCSVSGNTAISDAGGMFNGNPGHVITLNASSVTGNTAGASPAGIRNNGTVNLNAGSIVSGNMPGNCGGSGTFNGTGCEA